MAHCTPREPIGEARHAWAEAERRGDMDWLRDTTFISASCFKAAETTVRPRAWDRIAVPSAILRRSRDRIYKRVSTKPVIDTKYQAAVAELESQSFGARKRSRRTSYAPAYGVSMSERDTVSQVDGEEELARARDHVKAALRSIAKDNLNLRQIHHPTRSTFDPTKLTWIPRKRHNTRWPITPPDTHSSQIAPLQPLITFERFSSQAPVQPGLDRQKGEPTESPVRVPEPQEPPQQLQPQKSPRRRRTMRPSLGTILEDTNEALFFPTLTPGTNRRRTIYASPAKRPSAATGTRRTPTKVAESPLKTFTLTSTTPSSHMKGGKPDQDNHITPSIQSADKNGDYVPQSTDEAHSPSTTPRQKQNSSTTLVDTSTESSNTLLAAVALFDQPVTKEQKEPEHESKRRVSLDAARRIDRRAESRVMRRSSNWATGSLIGSTKRRHSDLSFLHDRPGVVHNRRRTLDIDVGSNLDIFGRPAGRLAIDEEPAAVILDAHHTLGEGTEAQMAKSASSGSTEQIDASSGSKGAIAQEDILNEAIPEDSTSKENTPDDTEEVTVTMEILPANDDIEGDSDLADLHNFVQRAKSKGKMESKNYTRPTFITKKRRSGSINSATSGTGSPLGKNESTAETATHASPRVPLSAKDPNKSPSPSKKRKLGRAGPEGAMSPVKKLSRLGVPDLEDNEPAAKPRKKRRGMESDTDDIFNPEMGPGQDLTQRRDGGGAGGARRSSRIATSKKTKPAAATISVRMPGGSGSLDFDMPVVSTAGVTNANRDRKAEKDLANETRANTRKNKGGAVPVPMALAVLSQSPAIADMDCGEDTMPMSTRSRPKGVRWAEVLVRVQGEDGETTVVAAVASTPIGEQDAAQNESPSEEDEDTQLPSPPQLRFDDVDRPGNPVGGHLAHSDSADDDDGRNERSEPESSLQKGASEDEKPKPRKSQPKRLTRSSGSATSRLPTPRSLGTPAKKKSSIGILPTPPSRIAKAGGTAGKGAGVGGGRGGASAAAIARLGMAGPGTPAPRRRAGVGR